MFGRQAKPVIGWTFCRSAYDYRTLMLSPIVAYWIESTLWCFTNSCQNQSGVMQNNDFPWEKSSVLFLCSFIIKTMPPCSDKTVAIAVSMLVADNQRQLFTTHNSIFFPGHFLLFVRALWSSPFLPSYLLKEADWSQTWFLVTSAVAQLGKFWLRINFRWSA